MGELRWAESGMAFLFNQHGLIVLPQNRDSLSGFEVFEFGGEGGLILVDKRSRALVVDRRLP